MLGRLVTGLLVGTSMIAIGQTAQAACTGVPASNDALANFEKEPSAWLTNEGNRSVASDIQALAVAASANPDLSAASDAHYAKFANALKTLLGNAGSDQSKALGTALGSLALTCGKAGREEAAFVTALQNGIAQSGNQFADSAYGKALNEPQTAATGGGAGGGSSGIGGPTGNAVGSGSSNTGAAPNSSNGTPTLAENFASSSGGNSGVLSSGTATTGTSGITTVTNVTNTVVTTH